MGKIKSIDANRRRTLKTGIPANSAVLPSEDRDAHHALTALYYSRFRPTRPEERLFVDEIVHADWLLLRLRRTETEVTTLLHQEAFRSNPDFPLGQPAADSPKVYSSLQWRLNSIRKARKQALAALRELRQNPIPTK